MAAVVSITMMLTIGVIAWAVKVALRLLGFLGQGLLLLAGVVVVLGQGFWAWLARRWAHVGEGKG